ncbi:MAG TPA: 2-oxo acid dehydrogenase subunit E2 [Chloroflexi bacterium]|nr:2-oxo acid dehydrogenase subunit E2 [Chloroflexota bacterium]
MATRLLAPSMGEGVEELTVVNWLKQEGDSVEELEAIVELETDKVTTEIPSPASGTLLKVLAKADETVKVGSILAWIGEPGEALETDEPDDDVVEAEPEAESADETPEAETETRAEEPDRDAEQDVYTGRVSPLVKKLVEMHDVDLNMVTGTGLDGRITKNDVLNYVEQREEAPKKEQKPTPQAKPAPKPAPVDRPGAPESELIPISSTRKQIAEHMVETVRTTPHVMTVMEADMSKVLAHRAANKQAFAVQGVNLTITAYFCSAIISALKENPNVNASYTDEGILRYRSINLGVAVALGEQGLIVPVIKQAEMLSLQGLAKQINDLADRARNKQLVPDEVKGGTFTLTNYGTGGSLFASPLIFQPQAAILGTGMMQKRPVVITDADGNDAIAIRPMVYLSLVFDHRILDGEGGDRFLMSVKKALEGW